MSRQYSLQWLVNVILMYRMAHVPCGISLGQIRHRSATIAQELESFEMHRFEHTVTAATVSKILIP